MPQFYNNYYELFIGGGAVLFEIQPEKVAIKDINTLLSNTYKTIANNPNEFIETVNVLDSVMVKMEKVLFNVGKSDIVLTKCKIAIFCDGEFFSWEGLGNSKAKTTERQ